MDGRGLPMPIMMDSEHQQALLIIEQERAFLIEENQRLLANLRCLVNQNQSAAGSIVSHGLPLLTEAGPSLPPPPSGNMIGYEGPNFQDAMMQLTHQEPQIQGGITQNDSAIGVFSRSPIPQQYTTTNEMQQNLAWNAPDSYEEDRHHIPHQDFYAWDKVKTREGDVASNPILYIPRDDLFLSEYQCLVRKQIEVFEVGPDELGSSAQGRNKPIVAGQVGVRCRHCSNIRHRNRGSHYFPAQIKNIYQAAQNMARAHLLHSCQLIPEDLRMELVRLESLKSSAGGGKPYWTEAASLLGIVEVDGIIRFKTPE